MPKRTQQEKEDRINRQIRRLQRKRQKLQQPTLDAETETGADNVDAPILEQDVVQSDDEEMDVLVVDEEPPTGLLVLPPPTPLPTALPSPPATDNTSDPDPLSQTLLAVLGEPADDTIAEGHELHTEVATRWNKILRNGLNKDQRKAIINDYPPPKNCPLMKAPKLNAEVEASISDPSRNRDFRMENKQQVITSALAALANVTNVILLDERMDKPTLLKTINDAGKMLCDLQYQETDSRKKLIMPLLDKAMSKMIAKRERDNFLFGENLTDAVKSCKTIKSTSIQLQASTAHIPTNKRQSGNWRGPPRPSAAPTTWTSRPTVVAGSNVSTGGLKHQPAPRGRQQARPPQTRNQPYRQRKFVPKQ